MNSPNHKLTPTEWLLIVLCVLLIVLACRPSLSAPAHPRIWLTPARIAAIRAERAADAPRWRSFQTALDFAGSIPNAYGSWWFSFALAYQATGNAAYADRAIALVEPAVAAGTRALTTAGAWPGQNSQWGYNVRGVLPMIAVTYDWCYDRLTPDQRTRWRAALEADADWVWPETNPARRGAWATDDPGDNFYYGFLLGTWLAGLALQDESPRAAGYVAEARRRFLTEASPFQARYQDGGYALEGTSYGLETLMRIWQVVDAHHTATGEDLTRLPSSGWLVDAASARLHLTLPDRAHVVPAGDQARDASAPVSDYARNSALVSLGYLPEPQRGWTRHWLDTIIPARNAWRDEQWCELVWAHPEVTAVDYARTLPPTYLAPGAGWVAARSGWDASATYLHVACGPVRASHQDLAQGGFLWARGADWLVGSARMRAAGGIQRGAADNNALLVGGRDQPEGDPRLPRDRPRIVAFADTPALTRVTLEAGDAYAYWRWPEPVLPLRGWRRTLLLLKPDRLVVLDRVEPTAPAEIRWNLNLLAAPTLEGNRFVVRVGASSLAGFLAAPTSGLAVVPRSEGPGGAASHWRLEAARADAVSRFAVLLRSAGADPAPIDGGALAATPEGVAVRFGTDLVVDSVGGSTVVRGDLGGIGRCLLLDVPSGGAFRVLAFDAANREVGRGAGTADPGGLGIVALGAPTAVRLEVRLD